MTERDFCYWLRGFVELQDSESITPSQWKTIKEHLDLVHTKVTQNFVTVKTEKMMDLPTNITC